MTNIADTILIQKENLHLVYKIDEEDYLGEGRYGIRLQFTGVTNKNYMDIWFNTKAKRNKIFKELEKELI